MTETVPPDPGRAPDRADDRADDIATDRAADIASEDAPTGHWRSGRHPVNTGHLVMGLAFVGLAVVWALVRSDAVGHDDVRWLLPVPWVVAGAAGLVAMVISGGRRAPDGDAGGVTGYGVRRTGWVGPTSTGPTSTGPTSTGPDDTRTTETGTMEE